ncbi:MAG: DEAD/DEAH box helicase [Candidatus Micrarchaeia archaeon]
MLVSELKGMAPNEFIESCRERGLERLTPPQELAIMAGLFKKKNIVVASPTASGKTLIAEMAMINSVIREQKKAVYVAPLRALVSEKFEEFKAYYPYLKIAISIGDLDSLDPWLEKYDIILVSTEKLDSLIRHGSEWIREVGCFVFDEIHMLGDASRGSVLEILITKLRRIVAGAQIVALSATIGNANEIAEWLDAELVESDYRPVLLKKGIILDGKIYYRDEEEELLGSSKIPEIRIVEDTIERGKQLIIFYSTKRNAEAGAEKISKIVEGYIRDEEKKELSEIGNNIKNVLGRPTSQCEKLAKVVERGVAFHHSGLVNEQRKIVEDSFRMGKIKAVCSTTTLSLGINMPAHTVVVRDTSRYNEFEGGEKLSVNEVTQLFGRAGRPKYDREGRALLIAKSKGEIIDLYTRYIDAELEPINSTLGMLPILRTHILAFVATEFLRSREAISNFFSESFYGYQYGNIREIDNIIGEILNEFLDWGFVERSGSLYNATRIGKRVSELYIDPLSAKWIIDMLPKRRDIIANLFMITNSIEMRPYVKVVEDAEEGFYRYKGFIDEWLEGEMNEFGFYDPLKALSTAYMLNDWINEKSEQEIVEKYSTTPGALHTKLTNADWLIYASSELAKIMHIPNIDLIELRLRLKYGIKEELLDLVRLEQVGRVRARLMYNNGIRSVSDLKSEGARKTVEKLFGKEIAEKILSQV